MRSCIAPAEGDSQPLDAAVLDAWVVFSQSRFPPRFHCTGWQACRHIQVSVQAASLQSLDLSRHRSRWVEEAGRLATTQAVCTG